jgi:hypothetical protein
MELTAENVDNVTLDCLFKDEELVDGLPTIEFIKVDGITRTWGLHPERLESHKEDVASMLDALPEGFRSGWSFLNVCQRADGVQWGEHKQCEALMVLGKGLGLVTQINDLMGMKLPGGVPYFRYLGRPN